MIGLISGIIYLGKMAKKDWEKEKKKSLKDVGFIFLCLFLFFVINYMYWGRRSVVFQQQQQQEPLGVSLGSGAYDDRQDRG